MNGRVYYIDKEDFTFHTLGYTQVGENGFNMSFTGDGTKDTTKLIVKGYQELSFMPNTIIYHADTQTWWVISHDKVSIYQTEGNTKWYEHELELVGAIELLNARDLTDCGFNNDKYTIDEFIKRLFKLSNCESIFDNLTINYRNIIDKDQIVDYLKTFENYTLASALREFLDGYNLYAKLGFIAANTTSPLNGVVLTLYSKGGNLSDTPKNMSYFDDIRETKTIDKNSFGTTVISNADNVVSTKTKIYPLVGAVRPSADNYNIFSPINNALIRLPSAVKQVNWVKFYNSKTFVSIRAYTGSVMQAGTYFDPTNEQSIRNMFVYAYNVVKTNVGQEEADEMLEELESKINDFLYFGEITLPNVNEYDPIADEASGSPFPQDMDLPVFLESGLNNEKEYVLGNKTLRDGVKFPNQVMYWEQGSNLIKGLEFFEWWHTGTIGTNNQTIKARDLKSKTIYYKSGEYHIDIVIGKTYENEELEYYVKNVVFRVEYVPMSDLKIKIDNSSTSKDIQLYNQNGKLNDSNALSKLLLSYSKEIESDTITKYKTFYLTTSYANNTEPKVGDVVVNDSGEFYVINNISLQFYTTESSTSGIYAYFVEGQFTMSKYVATKSLLTNPNTNIRDYGIPQKNNVKRKQIYRDFYEFSSTVQGDNDYYLTIDKVLNIGYTKQDYQEHRAIIRIQDYDNSNYYYQLDCSTFILKKSIYEVLDFQDNNVIGYDMQTKLSGFDITRIFSDTYDGINTPINYTDESGEFKNVWISFCTSEQVNNIYNVIDSTNGYKLAYHCFTSLDVYSGTQDYSDFSIIEQNYGKDALEIPVFEYGCQIDDTPEVIVGENIFNNKVTSEGNDLEFKNFLYSWALVPKNKVNQQNAKLFDPHIISPVIISVSPRQVGYVVTTNDEGMNGALDMYWTGDNKKLHLSFWKEIEYNVTTQTRESRTSMSPTLNKTDYDIVIFKHNIVNRALYTTDLFMIIRNVSAFTSTARTLTLEVNHYKL